METPKTENSRLFREIIFKHQTDEEIINRNQPLYFWISCSDYPISPNDAVGIAPTEFIFHENIANLTTAADVNFLVSMQYAVDIVRVKRIVVCGHYQCAGIKLATRSPEQFEIFGNWLLPILKTQQKHENLLNGIKNESSRLDALCELNVIEQTANICRLSIIENAWKSGQKLTVCGLIFNKQNQLLTDLNFNIENQNQILKGYAAAISKFGDVWNLETG